MILPVKFPADVDVIAEEAARFRSLSSDQRMAVLRGILDAGSLVLRNSSHLDFARQCAAEQEHAAQRAIRDFLARHGH